MSGLGFKMGILMSRKISDLDSHTSGDETSKKCIKFADIYRNSILAF